MDNLDRKIIKVLQANARASLQEIGQAVGLSASPCWERIKKMEQPGVIEGYTVRLNAQALDLADTVLVQVTLDSHSDNTLEKFGETLAAIPEVIEAYLVSGDRLPAARCRKRHTGLRAPAARAALQDQGHPSQQIELRPADHGEEGRSAALNVGVAARTRQRM